MNTYIFSTDYARLWELVQQGYKIIGENSGSVAYVYNNEPYVGLNWFETYEGLNWLETHEKGKTFELGDKKGFIDFCEEIKFQYIPPTVPEETQEPEAPQQFDIGKGGEG